MNNNELRPLPALKTIITSEKLNCSEEIDVTLNSKITELGTLEVRCLAQNGIDKWKLEFELRKFLNIKDWKIDNTIEENIGIKDEKNIEISITAIRSTFNEILNIGYPPEILMSKIETFSGLNKNKWPLEFLRKLWKIIIDNETGRKKGVDFEIRWYNLLGYSLRPGFGAELDDWRVKKTWELLEKNGMYNSNVTSCRCELWILWRRIAGGLQINQQIQLAEAAIKIWNHLFLKSSSIRKRNIETKINWNITINNNMSFSNNEISEILRMLGLLELLPVDYKIEIGQILLDVVKKDKSIKFIDEIIWVVGHLGSRNLIYGNLNNVIEYDVAEEWIRAILKLPELNGKHLISLVQLGRKTNDRFRDINENLRYEINAVNKKLKGPERYKKLVLEGGDLTNEDQRLVLGDSLPAGLKMKNIYNV